MDQAKLKKRKKLLEAKNKEAGLRLARSIARFANRVGRKLITAEPSEVPRLNASLLMLNQAQSVVNNHFKEAALLLSTAKRLSKIKDEE